MSSLLMLRAPGALIFNSIVSHGIFGKCLESLLERELEGSLPFSLLPVPWLRSWPLFPPSETPLWCPEDPYPPPYERKGVMPIPALGWGEGASGKLGKVVGQSTVGNPGFREVWQDPWGATWAPSHARGGCFHLLAPRLPGPMSTSPFLDNPSLRSGFLPSTLEGQGRPIALVVLDGVGNAIPRPENRGTGCTATWGLFGCGPSWVGSPGEYISV